jgi:hypothetical protein
MKRTIGLLLLVVVLSAATVAVAGDAQVSDQGRCSEACRPCPMPCATSCSF